MSPKTAANVLGVGFAVAATAALAQLGLAYGFGLLSWVDAAPGSTDPVLDYRGNANRAWVAWFAAASCVVGGLASGVIGSRGEATRPVVLRVGAVFASALGSFSVGPLVAVSAEQSAVFETFPTEPLLAAGVGSAVGFVLTLIGLGSRAVAVNVGASVALVWVLAVLAVFVEVGEPATPVTELAVWGSWVSPESALGRRGFSIAVPFVIGSALIGAIVALLARRGPITNSGYRIAAASGIAGPLIVTVAHLVAGPTPANDPESMAVILVGLYAAIAGLLGSLIVTAIPRSGGQIDDNVASEPEQSPVETAPWAVPEQPASSYDDTPSGDTGGQVYGSASAAKTKEMPGKPDGDASADDPEVDWVQELKPVDESGGDTKTAESEAEPEAKKKSKPKRRARKATRRKISSESESESESESKSESGSDSETEES
ncbi:DMT family transporter [Glycomyces xiaoerkulensis]|uniref:DMT family transporter n=1 Tax=Glycomyces xiaoerkulensis TaxID=2038139 RepID=UPI00130004F3|nr:DMT family transporter [Glycomyces xiaoerkulensis]